MELRNDDIILSGDAASSVMSTATEEIDDTSSPYVNPYYIDTDTSAGGAGEPIPSVQPVDPSDDIPEATTTTVTVTDTIIIDNYDPVYLQSLDQDGYTFYAVYDDGTVEEVEWTDVAPVDFDETVTINLEGLAVADAINQHFWSDTNGVHVTADTQDAWKAAVEANFDDLSVNKNYYNSLFNSLGLLFRRALFNLVAVTKEGIAFYDGVGNEPEDIMSFFGRYQAQIGRSNSKHVVIDNNGITAYNGDGSVAPLNASNITAAEANIRQLTANTADIATIRSNSAKVENLTAQELSAATGYISNLTSQNITAQNIASDHATIGSLSTTYAQIDGANITNLLATNGWVDKLMVSTGLLANDGTVFTLDAIKVNAESIVAGTIDVERLVVTVTEAGVQHKYLIHIDPTTGNPSYEKLDGDVIQDNTIIASKIVANSITTREITTQNLIGTNGWINLANGTFAYINSTSGQGIAWDGTHLTISGSVSVGNTPMELSTIASIASGTLLYDHSYVFNASHTVATFTAYLYRGGVDVKSEYDSSQFVWYYKTEDADEPVYIDSGYTCDVNISVMGFGGHVIGRFVQNADTNLLDEDDNNLTDLSNVPVSGRTPSGESVRISDLTVSTSVSSTDKLLISGPEDEHLITIQTLQQYLDSNLKQHVLFGTTAEWQAQTSLVSDADTIYIYRDHTVCSNGDVIAGIKVGDGNAYVADLPFTDEVLLDHINDNVRHITAAERQFWNNKVRCYASNGEELIFTTTA